MYGQVIDLHLVVQGERVVALAPVVADARHAVDDQRVDPELVEAGGDRQPRLSAADDQHRGITIDVLGGLPAQVEPVGSAEVARIGLAARPVGADMLFMPVQSLERRQQGPCPQTAPGTWREPHHAAAAPVGGLEREDRLDRLDAGADHAAWRRALRIDRETRRLRARHAIAEAFDHGLSATDGFDLPGERKHIAPMAVGVEQGPELHPIGCRERVLELDQPVCCRPLDLLGVIAHRFFHVLEYAAPIDRNRAGVTGETPGAYMDIDAVTGASARLIGRSAPKKGVRRTRLPWYRYNL
jgi:hypothetical protein